MVDDGMLFALLESEQAEDADDDDQRLSRVSGRLIQSHL